MGVRFYKRPQSKGTHFSRLLPELSICCLVPRGSTDELVLLLIFSGVV